MEERGEWHPWENVYPRISRQRYEDYIYAYECRLHRQREEFLEKTCPNYWARRITLSKFDEWKEWGNPYPWHWGFEEIRARRHGKIRTPRQFLRSLVACMQFVVEEKQRNPGWELPEAFIALMARLKPFFDSLRPICEARLKGDPAESALLESKPVVG
jgi:hypothetical protein